MDLLFLGTSSGTPTRERNVTALALIEQTSSAWYLVDCGEGTQHQLLRVPPSLADLEAIFITHVHGDHCYGLPGLLASAGMQARTKLLAIVAPAGIKEWLDATLQLTRLTLPFDLKHVETESLQDWTINNWIVDAFPLSHRVPSYGYRFTEARTQAHLDVEKLVADGIPRGPLWGQLRNGTDVDFNGKLLKGSDYLRYPDARRRLVIGGDNDKPQLLRDACADAQVLVHESTFTQDIADETGARFGHSAAAAVAAFAQSAGVPSLILTHFSARYQSRADRSPSIDDIREEAQQQYHGRLHLAEDFSRYRLDRQGQLTRIS